MATNVLVPFIVFASIFGVIYVYLTTRNKERLALIEKGAAYSLCIFFFAGLSLVIYFFVARKLETKK